MIDGLTLKKRLLGEIGKAVIGKDEIIVKVTAAILAGGHILLEDIPGVGKTTLAVAFSKALTLDYNRLQFTPDVMPSDVVGYQMYNKDTGDFQYKTGVIMCNLFLADEINRTSSKTQSALLEAMEEGSVTVEGKQMKLPEPFVVLATQNPIGSAGTTLLPDSQLDRFMVRLSMGYPAKEDEITMLKKKMGGNNPINEINKILSHEEIIEIKKYVSEIFVHDKIYEYIITLVNATRTSKYLEVGISPRGTVALVAIAKAVAYMNNRNYVIPEDIQQVFIATTAHRVILNSEAKMSKLTSEDVLNRIMENVKLTNKVK